MSVKLFSEVVSGSTSTLLQMTSPTLIQKILRIAIASRPPSWAFGPILFGIGLIHSRQIPKSIPVLALAALQIFSLSIPLSIIVFGINDVHDFESDSRNPRKLRNGLQGGVLQPEYHALARTTAQVSTILIIGASLANRQRYNAIATLCLVFVGWQYSSPPLRLKEVPVMDSLSNGLIVFLSWFIGFSFSGKGLLDVPSKGFMLSLCTTGIHALGAVIDVEADIAAGQRTIAIALGQRPTAIFSALCYLCAAFTEEPNSIFGVYLWAGTLVMLVPCLKVSFAQRTFEVIVYMSIICSLIWFGVRAKGLVKGSKGE